MRRLLGWVLALGLIWLGSSCLAAHWISRRPAPPYAEALPNVPWAESVAVEMTASDGARVRGYGLDVVGSRGTAILLHMNRADRGAMLPAAEAWAKLGYSSVAITLRSHGDAEGGRLDFGRTARLDAIAAVNWVHNRGSGEVFVHGVSLGSAAALFAADSLRGKVAGYVFEAPYTDVVDATYNRTSIFLPPVLDRVAGWSLLTVAPWFVPGIAEIAPLVAASDLEKDIPVLVLIGSRDRYSTPAQMDRFRDVLGPRGTFATADVGHTEWLWDVPMMTRTLAEWIEGM